MSITHLPFEQAQYLLNEGHASLADAEEYAVLWNKHKLETRCSVVVTQRPPHKHSTITVATPVLVLEPAALTGADRFRNKKSLLIHCDVCFIDCGMTDIRTGGRTDEVPQIESYHRVVYHRRRSAAYQPAHAGRLRQYFPQVDRLSWRSGLRRHRRADVGKVLRTIAHRLKR